MLTAKIARMSSLFDVVQCTYAASQKHDTIFDHNFGKCRQSIKSVPCIEIKSHLLRKLAPGQTHAGPVFYTDH